MDHLNTSTSMDRKKFILNSTFAAFAMTTFGQVVSKKDGTFKGNCETTNDILGPFYRENAPIRSDLTFEGLKGSRIKVKGTVYQGDCTTPIPNALVEIWHCDTTGSYDNDSDEYRHRATWKTNAKGEYSFSTIIPGKYLNGALYRPSHIHFRVTAEGSEELISQIYFKGDPHITDDPWASKEKAENRILEIIPEDVASNLSILFDINLKDV